MKLVLKSKPIKGEIACCKDNFDMDFFMFSRFTQHDEEIANNNDKQYYVIIS